MPNFVSWEKENLILPDEIPRQFETIYGLMSLGFAQDYAGRTVGRAFRKEADGAAKASWSQYYYYLPEDEGQWPSFHIWCANPEKTLIPKGNCIAKSQISRDVYVEYSFSASYLAHWQAIDDIVKQIVRVVPSR